MPVGMTFWVQGFEHVAGRLVATTKSHAQSEPHALRQAEALARQLPGAAAFTLSARTDGTEIRTILGAFGDVPDDVIDGLAGG